MTIPTRPAPAPPGPRGLNAAAGANASLEQLRMQLQEQQQQQSYQQNGGVKKLTIKLPPPPNSRNNGATPLGNSLQQKSFNHINNNNNNYNINNNGCNGSSITRKFPQANVRYAPATSWDGLPFEPTAPTTTTNTNSGFKKVPPPRPPPPKVQFISKKTTAPAPPQSVNILNNIFNRKKSIKAPAPNKSGRLTPAGVYGTSSGTYSTTISSSSTTSQINNSSYGATNASLNSWGTSTAFSAYTTTTTTTSSQQQQEAQLISFDSPPSSPTFTQKSNSDCVSVDSFSSDSNFSSPHNGSVSQPESGFEDDFTARSRSRTSPLDPWETLDAFSNTTDSNSYGSTTGATIGTAPVRNLSTINTRIQSSNDNPLCNGKSLLPPAPSLTAPTIIKPKISQKPKAPKPPVLNNNFRNSNTNSAYNMDQLSTPPSPPMPQCAPPPPPLGSVGTNISMLDVITGKVDALQLAQNASYDMEESGPAYGYALYDFDGLEDGDLSFRENEKIYLLEQVSDEWYRGRTRSGCEGIFPSNYVDIRIPLVVPSAKNATTTTTTTTAATNIASNFTMQTTHTTASSYEIPKVKCLYNFPAEVDGDLSLRENDMVTILYKINEDWLYGRIDEREGQFPANFLEYIPAHVPMP